MRRAGLLALGLLAVAAAAQGADRQPPSQLRVVLVDQSAGELSVDDGTRPRPIGSAFYFDGLESYGVPAWSPDGTRIAYFRGGRTSAEIVVHRWSGSGVSQPRAVTPPMRGSRAPDLSVLAPAHLDWSPDGSKLAFVSKGANLTVVATAGRRVWRFSTRRLGDPAWEYGWAYLVVSWAPDSERLAVTGRDRRSWIADLRTGRLRLLAPRARLVNTPAWSPDGTKLAYSRGDRRGNGQLWVISADGRRASRLTHDVPVDRYAHFTNVDPVWSPDGRRIAFLSNRDGHDDEELFVIDADGRHEQRLTRAAVVSAAPKWSPDGQRLGFLGWARYGLVGRLATVGSHGGRLQLSLRPAPIGEPRSYDWSWVPGRRVRPARVPLPGATAVHWIVAARNHAPAGKTRVVDVRSLGLPPDQRLSSLSRSGAVAAWTRSTGEQTFDVGVLDLVHGTTRVVGKGADFSYIQEAQISPDGRSVLYQRWARLVVTDIATGRSTVVAHYGAAVGARWLADGRIAYVSRQLQLTFVRPGSRPVGTGIRIPKPDAFGVSPDGRRIVYADAQRRVRLLDRATGRRRRLPDNLTPSAAAFSPDGKLLALARHLTTNDGPGADVILYRADGKRLAALVGNRESADYMTPVWSSDGRWLLATMIYGGTRQGPSPLYAYSVPTGRSTRIARGWGAPLVGPGGWVLFTVGDRLRLGRLS